jgi:hypothetical protein
VIRAISIGVLLVASGLFAGCETTQEKSAKLEVSGAGLAQTDTVKLTASNREIEVVDKTVLTDQYGTAVIVRLRNTGTQPQVDVPIQVDIKDPKGKSVFKNDTEGLEDGLLNIQVIEPGKETWWVHDQVFPMGKAAGFDVTIGKSEVPPPASIPKLTATKPEINEDPVSGIEVQGEITNESEVEQTDLLIYAVATKGGKVVAAGRGLIPKLKTGPKGEPYNIFFIGDPIGADIEVFATPNTFE